MAGLYIIKRFGETDVRARQNDKYVDATALCKAAGNKKRWADYDRIPAHQAFREVTARKVGIPIFQMVEKRQGNGGGTWVHPEIAIHLCIWISPEFASNVTGWVEELFTKGRVELDPAPVPSGFVAVGPDLSDPYDQQLVLMQQTCAALIENRRRQVALERRSQELARRQAEIEAKVDEARADVADTRALAVCAANTARAAMKHATSDYEYYTILGFAKLNNWEMPVAESSQHGIALAGLCEDRGIKREPMKDPRFGKVWAYPESLLCEYFAERLQGNNNAT